MSSAREFVTQLEAYSIWRENISGALEDFRSWLAEQELSDAQIDLRIQHLLDRLRDDKLYVAFVAEFSRGKSELINAIFFADYKQRLLPSSAGRTTMCPTELLFDEEREPCIQLLPIETRASSTTTSEYKRYPDEWVVTPLNVASSKDMAEALKQVSQLKKASVADAKKFGLYDETDEFNFLTVADDGTVEIPCWRHAIINFPHPLLKKGLVILDTPGLNAIGTEPELTLNLLPNAHAILFILAADTGVTKSDIEVWRSHICHAQGRQSGRLVVLNKIDGLWDELKSLEEVAADIDRQVSSCAEILALDRGNIFPVSALKALTAKINNDAGMLEKSRMPALEDALSDELIPSKQEIVRDSTQSEIEDMVGNTRTILDARQAGLRDQLGMLEGLRGKNRAVIANMNDKVEQERAQFDQSLQRFHALRSVFNQQSEKLFAHLGLDAIRAEARRTQEQMETALFTKNLREAMDRFFAHVSESFRRSSEQVEEIKNMMTTMYQRFSAEHGLAAVVPPEFSTLKYRKEIERLQTAYNEHFNTTFNLINSDKTTIITKFFETLANRVVRVYELANRDVERWLGAVMAPMETQVREHHLQLKRRTESIKRILNAVDTIEDRIKELEQIEAGINKQIHELDLLQRNLHNALGATVAESARAA